MLQLSSIEGWVGRGALTAAFVAGALALFLMMGGPGEGQECPANTECIEYPEHGSGTVVGYSAVDPEGEDVGWGVSGTDATLFDIEEGRLTFNSPPDYEDPDDNGTDNVYNVTVEATAGRGNSVLTTRQNVVITVTNIEEAGEITLSTLQPQLEVAITATLRDPDGGVDDSLPIDATERNLTGEDTTEWQWARAARVSGPWADIEDDPDTNDVDEGQEFSYTPTEDDVGMYLRATASYVDGHCEACDPKNTAQAISANAAQGEPYTNEAPEFDVESFDEDPGATGVQIYVAENSAEGTAVGAPVSATDLGPDGRQEILTYTLTDTSGLFSIDHGTGQIRVGVGAALAYETSMPTYAVTVRAADPSNSPAMVAVSIIVTDVDEAPTITTGQSAIDHAEINDKDDPRVVTTYAAEDADAKDTAAALKWSLSGRDAGKFAIGNDTTDDRGVLSFREQPDFENPTDSGLDNIYNVTVSVTDRGGNSASMDVTVRVTNVNEEGTLYVSNLHPRENTRTTATVTDPDTPITDILWTWRVGGQTVTQSSTYTPKTEDIGSLLTVQVTYTDGTDRKQTIPENSPLSLDTVVARKTDTNQRPSFAGRSNRITIAEDAAEDGLNLGPVTATDDDGDLTYSISGTDAASFSFNQDTAVIRPVVSLDYERKRSYRVTVTAEDSSRERGTLSLTIEVRDVDEAPEITSGDSTVFYAENGTGTVATYGAVDPERKAIVWTLSGNDDDDKFTIAGGQLRFKNPPDFEDTDLDANKTLTATVRASDGGSGSHDEKTVSIVITNVDEEGTVELSAEQPKAGVQLTATLTEPDGDPNSNDIDWQWARGSSRAGTYTDIEEDGNEVSYTPVEDDVGKYLRATATYKDAESTVTTKSAHVTAQRTTEREDCAVGPPVFKDADGVELTTSIERTVKENSRSGTNVGTPVAATDVGRNCRPERLTYTLGGTDAESFTIVRNSGQIRVKSGTMLDHETTASYTVEVTAADPSDKTGAESRDAITVNIRVTNVDETPTFTAGDTTVSYDENDEAQVGATYVANDQESSTPTWALSGTDADDFEIDGGTLEFREPPDYEAPTDSDRRNTYDVTVEATDGGDNKVSRRVRVTVRNVEEEGTVTLSHTQPEVGASITASLSDPDNARSVTWQWYRGTPSETFCDSDGQPSCRIRSNSNRSSYTPVAGDVGRLLTARANYTDGHGSGKVMDSGATTPVRAEQTNNNAPEFQSNGVRITSDTRTVAENTPTDQSLKTLDVPVTAIDQETDTLIYSLTGTDAATFAINRESGQITARETLNYETKRSYRVTVRAVDPSDDSATITVTITVTDLDEPPELSKKGLVALGRGFISHNENQGGEVARYSATGPQAGNVSWRLSGTDASDFSISRSGVLTFRSTPNFERPVDADQDNTYEFTVTARSGSIEDSIEVMVSVNNADEDGAVTLSPTRGSVGGRITATVTDVDGEVTGVFWEWLRSADGSTNWITIIGAGSDSYTATADDVGYYLQAVASYEDPEGSGKSATAKTTAAVVADDDGRIALSQNTPAVGDTLTATLTDPDGSIANTAWQWARSGDGTTWTDIPGATRASYRVVQGDIGNYLRATADYDDGDGVGKSAEGLTTAAAIADNDGEVALSPAQLTDGDTVTATLTDPDGGITNLRWQWASSADGSTGWTNISRATSRSYRAATLDVDRYLRATASYDDRDGTGKTAEAITSGSVGEDDDGTVTLSSAQLEVGNEISASLNDPDGGVRALTWQWESSANGTSGWAILSQATSDSYTPEPANVGRFLRVTAQYTDSVGPDKSAEAITAARVQADDDGVVTLSTLELVEGETVTVTLTDPDGGETGITWQWQISSNGSTGWEDIPGATFVTYTPVAANVGRFIRATASYTDAVGPDKSAESASTESVSADDDGVITISPSQPVVGEVVTANLTDPDSGVTGVNWQWQMSRNGSTGWTNRLEATSPTYTPVAADVGFYLRATASYADSVSPGKSAQSLASLSIIADDDGEVALSTSEPEHGAMISATLSDPDSGITGVTWQWARSSDGQTGWTNIAGATLETYTPDVSNVDNYLRATASYTDSVGPDKSARGVTSAPVRLDDDGSVTLSWEELTVGEAVTASITDPDNGVINVEWQWARSADGSANWTNIIGATSETYTPVEGDVNSYLRATASYDDDAGIGKSARAVTSSAVIADDDGSVTLSTSEPEVGAVVTAALSDPDDGVTNVSWQWAKSDDGSAGWTDIQGATSASYRPGKSDEGVYLRATASYDDAVGAGKSARAVTSAAVITDDDGSVTLSTSEPEVGAVVTAALSDPDEGVMNVSWQWAKSDDGSTGWTDIQGATSASYRLGKSDEGVYLRATASYDDAAGIGKSAQAVTSAAVITDDDGSVTLSTSEPEVGAAVTATLSDPDEGVTNVSWQWAKSDDGSTGWTDIQGATSTSYTPGKSDEGIYLRATASYDDAAGIGKSAQAITSTGVAQMELLTKYDSDRNGSIDRSEAIDAVTDYFDDEITKDEVLAVLVLYFSG